MNLKSRRDMVRHWPRAVLMGFQLLGIAVLVCLLNLLLFLPLLLLPIRPRLWLAEKSIGLVGGLEGKV